MNESPLSVAAPIPMERPSSRPWLRSLVLSGLRRWQHGHLTLRFPDGDIAAFGDANATDRATVFVRDDAIARRLTLGGEIALGDAYVEGLWDADDLVALLRLFVRNRASLKFNSPLARIAQLGSWIDERLRSNTKDGAQRNVHAHYDLGNDLYRLFLDPQTMAYSCAVYGSPEETLEQAQTRKLELVCSKLELSAADHLVEIGSGWGGLAIHAARTRGCRVTTATVSREQLALARQRIAEAGLSDRIEVIYSDYRDLPGQYDKLVSIEMFEQVGHRFYGDFFATCARLLKPNGIGVMQTIAMPDQDYAAYLKSVDWMQRRIFPGTCLPSLRAMLEAMTKRTDLVIRHVEDIGPHYAPTLRAWRERFLARREDAARLGYDRAFARTWELYLAFSEASFAERSLQDYQLTFAHVGARSE